LEIDFEGLKTAGTVGSFLRAAEVCEFVDPPVLEVSGAAEVVVCTIAELIEDIVVVAVGAGG
jgi:hypothetical protein